MRSLAPSLHRLCNVPARRCMIHQRIHVSPHRSFSANGSNSQQRGGSYQHALPRGTFDILPPECRKRRKILRDCESIVSLYGFNEIQTPIFESADVFTRALGKEADVVKKEMYMFPDRLKKTMFALRPENTAPIMRSAMKMIHPAAKNVSVQTIDPPLNYYYYGPMFRYERPQRGRFRQFHQFGVESIGVDGPYEDAQVISMAWDVLVKLGIESGVQLQINTLGDASCIKNYEAKLEQYFAPLDSRLLSADTYDKIKGGRYLRILDSKHEEDRTAIQNAPSILDSLDSGSRKRFDTLCKLLDHLRIPYKINSRLVRGLDYYLHTIFEFVAVAGEDQELGSAILAGGRYDRLATAMGRAVGIGAVGWAFGMERILLEMERKNPISEESIGGILVAPIVSGAGQATADLASKILMESMNIARSVRGEGVRAELWHSEVSLISSKMVQDPDGSIVARGNALTIKKALEAANRSSCKGAIFLGDSELSQGMCTLRNLSSKRLEQVRISEVGPLCADLEKGKW